MFAQLNIYKNLIIGSIVFTLILGLYFYIHLLKLQIDNLQNTLKDSYMEAANLKLQSERYKNILDVQSKEIEDARINESLAKKKLLEWRAKPPSIKYKIITKIREVKSNDCKDIKNTIDAIRHIDYDKL